MGDDSLHPLSKARGPGGRGADTPPPGQTPTCPRSVLCKMQAGGCQIHGCSCEHFGPRASGFNFRKTVNTYTVYDMTLPWGLGLSMQSMLRSFSSRVRFTLSRTFADPSPVQPVMAEGL